MELTANYDLMIGMPVDSLAELALRRRSEVRAFRLLTACPGVVR
jgi:hypothetical protein